MRGAVVRDNPLFTFLRSALLDMLPARGLTGILIKQSYQPKQHGRPNQSTVFLHKITDRRHGSRAVREGFDDDLGQLRTESQVMETTIQFNALASERDPENNEELTAADMLKTVAAALQSVEFIERARKSGVQVLRIQEIRNAPFENERGRFEFDPSFDAVFTHADEYTQPINHVTHFTEGFYGI